MPEVLHKRFGATLEPGIAGYVVRHGEAVVPGAALMEAGRIGEIGPVLRIEGSEERAVHVNGTQALEFRGVVVPVPQRALVEAGGVGLPAQRSGQA